MTFLNMAILGGLLFCALPVIIYYLINRKKTVLSFAAYEWMKKAVQKRRKKNKIDDLLKLIAKTMLILALVLFMARPAISSKSGSEILLVVDHTLSMGASAGVSTKLDLARNAAEKLMREQNPASVTLLSFDGALKEIVRKGKRAAVPSARIQGIELSSESGTFLELVAALADLPDFRTFDTFCFISDFQKKDYADATLFSEAIGRLSGKRIIFLPVGERAATPNLALESFRVPDEGFFPGRENHILVTVRNYSNDAQTVPVTLSVNNVRKDRVFITLQPYSRGEAVLSLQLPDVGEDASVEIELPPDSFNLDNKLALVGRNSKKTNILSIQKEKGNAPFAYDTFFRNCLEAVAGTNGNYFRYKSVPYHAAGNENFDDYDIILCFGIPFSANTKLTDSLLEAVRRGKSLISFSDLSTDSFWKTLNINAKTLSRTENKTHIPDKLRLSGTYLEFMLDQSLAPELLTFRKASGIHVPENMKAVGKLFLTGEKAPVIAKLPLGAGSVILAGFMPSPEYTAMVYNPNFVQFVMRMISDASPRNYFSYYIGRDSQFIPLPNADEPENHVFSVEAPDGKKEYLAWNADNYQPSLSLMRPFAENSVCTILSDTQKLFRIGNNVTRNDSDLASAGSEDFREAMEKGLIWDTEGNPARIAAWRELSILMTLLLLAALGFDYYAHFLRRKA